MIPNYRIFAPNFQVRNYFCAQDFENVVASNIFHKLFTFTFHSIMPQGSPNDQVGDVVVAQPGTGNLW